MSTRITPALAHELRPVRQYLDNDKTTEVSINKPGEIWVESSDTGIRSHASKSVTFNGLMGLAKVAADYNNQHISEENPLMSGGLPGGLRIQIAIPPAAAPDHVVVSIRKHRQLNLTPADYVNAGSFSDTNEHTEFTDTAELTSLEERKQWPEFIRAAIERKKNIVISGGTNTGKTTFLNAFARYIPDTDRLVTIEDAPELNLPQPNIAQLYYSRGQEQGLGNHTAADLLESSLRLRPDRIIYGELRGTEAFSFLRSINTGHPGSMTSVHANNPRMALEQMSMMVMQGETTLERADVLSYIRSLVDVIIQLQRRPSGDRVISEISWNR